MSQTIGQLRELTKNTIEKILSSNADEIEEIMIFVLTYNESNNYCVTLPLQTNYYMLQLVIRHWGLYIVSS